MAEHVEQPAEGAEEGRQDIPEQPNVVMILCDQLRADHLGFGGNEHVRTPNLDALAEESVVFDEAYVANPTCMPNRASLLTGRYPSAHGTRFNGIPLDPDSSTMVRQMARAGYHTMAVGKLHHQNMGWPLEEEQQKQVERTSPLLTDPESPDAREPSREPGWDEWENRARHDEAYVPLPPDYYGYDDVDLVIGHGDAPGGHWRWWAREQGVEPDELGGVAASVQAQQDWDQVYVSSIPASVHPTAYIGERSVERIREEAAAASAAGEDARRRPFFLSVSFPDPHHPFAPPAEYADRYRPEDMELPVGFHQDHEHSPAHIRAMARHRGEPDQDPTMSFCATEHQYRTAVAAQYGLIEFMDEQVGRVLDALRETGQARDTIVIFTADHGDLFGDHGLMLKHFVHYRAVTRVPLVFHDPRHPEWRGRREALVSSVDIPATLIEETGSAPIRGMHGRSLLPVLAGDDHLRDAVLIEEDQPFSPRGLPAPVRMRTVITPEGRLTRYFGSDEVELYDHRTDPEELHNLAGDPAAAALKARLTEAMVEQMAEVAETGIAPTAAA